jgi:prepilin-type N-terminal cleavage/methylation domain-containing protein
MKRLRGVQGLPARFKAGFTKLELLVVMSILAISASLAVPAFSRWLPNYRLKGAVRELYSNLQFAKSGAIRDRGEWAIKFDAGGNSYQVVTGGPDGVYTTTGDNVVLKTVSLPAYGSGLSFGPGSAVRKVGRNEPIADSISFPGDRVVFNSRGMVTGTFGGYAYLQNDRNACYAVGTWSSGIVVLRKWNGSAWE